MIVLFTALIAPYFIDWTSYKQDFERETSRIIGQNVEVLGETSVRLLPLPSVTYGGLAVGRNTDGTPMMTVDQFAINIELMPLLKGEVTIVDMKLVRPRVNLHVDENGAIAWTNRQQPAVDPEQIKLENLSVINGEVKISGLAGGRTLSLEQLDGRLSAKSLYGPWRINANGYVGEKRARIDISTGHLQDDGSIRVKLAVKRSDLPYKLSLDGSVQLYDGLLRWDGDYELGAQNNDGDKRQRALPIFSQGSFGATPRVIEVPEFRLEIGAREDPYTITGTGSAQIGKTVSFQIQADGRQIDLDRVGQVNGTNSEGGGLSLEQRLQVLRTILEKVPVPTAEGIIDLSLPAIVAGDTLIREVSTVISPDNDGWEIKRLNAIFPGNTKFEAKGKVGLHQAFGFTGSMLVASRQPTGLAAWLGKRGNPFIRKLSSAGFTADVVISDNQASLENLQLVLDDAVLKGKLQRLAAGDGRPAIIARLEGSEIILDDLRAVFALMTDDDAEVITNHDLDISLNAGKLTGFDISAENVETRFRISGGSVSVEKLNASNFFGATLTSSGRIDNLLKQPNGNFKLAVKTKNSSRLLKFIQSRIPKNKLLKSLRRSLGLSPGLANDIDLVFEINARSSYKNSGNGSTGQAFIRGVAGGTKIEITTEFKGRPEAFDAALLDVTSTLENANPAKLLAQLGLAVLPIDVAGPLKITGNFTGAPKDGFDSFVTAQMSGTNVTASGMIYPVGENAGDAALKMTLASRDIDPLLVLAGIAIPSQTFATGTIPISFSGDFKLQKNRVILSRGEGQIKGQEFSVDLNFEKNTTSNHRINGKLTATAMDLPLLAQFAFTSSGIDEIDADSGWNKTNFGQAMLQGLDGKIELSVGSSDFGIGQPAKNLEGQLALVDGSINLNEVKGQWLDGSFIANLSLTNAEGIGSLSAQYKFKNIDTQSLTRALGTSDFISGNVNIMGNLEGSGRSPAAIVSSLTGSGAIDMKEMKISGLNTSPLAHVLAAVDQEGFEIQDEYVLPVLAQVIDDGNVEVSAVSIPYMVGAGKLRARNISVEAANTNMVGAVEIDIARRTVNSELSVRFDPGKEWVDGADPQIFMAWNGDIKAPKRSIDVQPLSGYLSLRNFEREQRRVDLLQASILEKQRLRRDIIVTNARVRYRQRLRREELRRQRQAFLKLEETRLHELARERHFEMLALERAIREEERRKAEEAERKRLAEEARKIAEAERLRKEEEARIAAEAERKRIAAEARKAEAERKRIAREARKAAAAAERKRIAEAARKAEAEAEHKRIAEEARKAEAEAEHKRIAEEARKAEAERLRLEEEARRETEEALRQLNENPIVQNPVPQKKPVKPVDDFAKRLKDFLDSR